MTRTLAFTILLTSTSALAQETGPAIDLAGTYYCRSTAAAGLVLDKNTNVWTGTTFNVADDAYSIKITDTGKVGVTDSPLKMPYHVYQTTIKKFGSQDEPHNCWDMSPNNGGRDDIQVFGDNLRCRLIGSEYTFNMKAGKFQVMFEGGYMDDWRENTDTPYVSVGKCEKID